MATTATITLASTDLTSDALSLSSTQTLYDAGTTNSVAEYDMGKIEIPAGETNLILIQATAAGNDKASKVYVANKNTDETHYVIISINDAVIGRLYAGDWMFIPWSQVDVNSEIRIKAPNEVNAIEYLHIHEGRTITSA